METNIMVGRKATDNGIDKFYGECYKEGFIYKDEEAFKRQSGVCYIPECAFEMTEENDGAVEVTDDNIYTYEDIRRAVLTHTNDLDEEVPNEFVRYMCECAFNSVDWECIETYLNEIDFEAEYAEWNDRKN